MSGSTSPELEVAVRAARQAGAVAMRYQAEGLRVEYKGARDVVTDADRASQALITDLIAEAFPGDGLVGEEGAVLPESAVVGTRRWYVDPVDGTSNFVKGRHWWAVSVAFCDADDRLKAGAVYLPALDQMYAAADGQGATLNGVGVRCSPTTGLDEALCASGFPTAQGATEASERNLAVWRGLIHRAQSLRATGAVAPDWSSIASGQTDAAWTLGVGRWDIAAGIVIAREAGARVTDFDGRDLTGPATQGVAAVPGVHEELLAILHDALGDRRD